MDDLIPETDLPADVQAMLNARREALLRINPHFYYDEHDRYSMVDAVIPMGRWVTMELAVRSFGWEKVERSPDVQRMLAEVPRAACHYVNEAVIRVAHRTDQA